VDVDHRIPQVIVHVGECLVTQNTSVVDQDVNTSVGVNGGLDNSGTIFA
jgi:hypothetical protein